MSRLLLASSLLALAASSDVARTPPMGCESYQNPKPGCSPPRLSRLSCRKRRRVLAATSNPKTRPQNAPVVNTWNLYHCSVDAAILNSTAKAIVDSGLAKVGYEYVNSE